MFYLRSVFSFPGGRDVKATPFCCVTFFLFHSVVTLETFNKLFSTPFKTLIHWLATPAELFFGMS